MSVSRHFRPEVSAPRTTLEFGLSKGWDFRTVQRTGDSAFGLCPVMRIDRLNASNGGVIQTSFIRWSPKSVLLKVWSAAHWWSAEHFQWAAASQVHGPQVVRGVVRGGPRWGRGGPRRAAARIITKNTKNNVVKVLIKKLKLRRLPPFFELRKLRRLPPLELRKLRRLPPLELRKLRRLPPSSNWENFADYPPPSNFPPDTVNHQVFSCVGRMILPQQIVVREKKVWEALP